MKVLILAGGRGKRLGQTTENQNKCMLNVAGTPLIEYSLNCAVNLDISEIVIVVGYKAEEIINKHGNEYKQTPIKYVIQQEQKGLVHAIECSKNTIGNDDFMLMLGDEVMVNPRHKEMLLKFQEEDLFSICGTVAVKDKTLISKTYSIIQGEDDRIYRLIEKPKNPLNNIMGTGNCVFRNEIFSYIEQTPINQKRGEKELPDLIQCAIDDGQIVKSLCICDSYSNVNSEIELKEALSCFSHL
ncbi:MAG: nucleotidyltransferase family protein [Planctomycetia bacterium]|nr:nucleotidyltransferase family protein [Planctomycetia bacterium]